MVLSSRCSVVRSDPARREQLAQEHERGGERALLLGIELFRHQVREPEMSRGTVRGKDLAPCSRQGDKATARVLCIVATGYATALFERGDEPTHRLRRD